MKICVLLPDYSTTSVDYKEYDPVRNLSALMPEAQMDHVFINKLSTYKQLRDLGKKGYDIFVNLCEGYPDWEVPGYDIYFNAELLNLPITGPGTRLFDVPKKLMKYVAYSEGVKVPAYALISSLDEIKSETQHLNYPLFVKPAHSGDSRGIDEHSLVHNVEELKNKCASIIEEHGSLLVEEYISGREFTVLVAANADNPKECTTFKPVEYIFPEGLEFKTYALKTWELHPDCNHPCNDPDLEKELRAAAKRIFQAFSGVGYCRMDFRVNEKGEIYFLELNFTCSVFYTDGWDGSADFILKFDGIGQAGFLRHIIEEGIARHKRKQKPFEIKGNSIAGFGIYANREIPAGEIVFYGEGKAQRIISRRYMERNWNEREKENFRRYAYPISKEVYILWDVDPSEWAPQNHSCDPNTEFNGLNVIAIKNISKGEELTLDYARFLDESMEPFQCSCSSPDCRGMIFGIKDMSVTYKEQLKKPGRRHSRPIAPYKPSVSEHQKG
ncbi:MAG: hypothetical protein B6D37_13890 [Sphingobacteriales bacterium UTBCD1]|jgi:D-alanine-D-alanine ligase|nr:MAG: hypothetical protein B6D37_13890 [Sphingobacteriales bacterium UTBCD1]